MTDYSQLSDFEINKLVAIALGLEVKDWPEADRPYIWHVVKNELGNDYFDYTDYKDYCNNPADAWPIIVGSKINIRFGAEGMACEAQFMQYGHESVEHYHANPLRAAMVVFLMMQEKSK